MAMAASPRVMQIGNGGWPEVRARRDPEKERGFRLSPATTPSSSIPSQQPLARSLVRECTRGLMDLYVSVAPSRPPSYAANRGQLEAWPSRNRDDKSEHLPRRRVLTSPSTGGPDNEDGELICRTGDTLMASNPTSGFEILDLLGKGSFGQVFRCRSQKTGNLVACKVVKNKHSYLNQAQYEATLARRLGDVACENIVNFYGTFHHMGHVVLCFEALSMNIYELLRQNQYRGLPLDTVRHLTAQIVSALGALDSLKVVHCDLKPENILLCQQHDHDFATRPTLVKVIDFGSACAEGKITQSYVQSRFYRAPEVLIGGLYDTAVDMWSCACVSAELMLGLPIFPGDHAHDQLVRIVDMFGTPPDDLLVRGNDTFDYFAVMAGHFQLKSPEQYAYEKRFKPKHGPKQPYFTYRELADIVRNYPVPAGLSAKGHADLRDKRIVFTHFLLRLLKYRPEDRLTPTQAAAHPFLVGGSVDDWLPPHDPRVQDHAEFAQRCKHRLEFYRGPPPNAYPHTAPSYYLAAPAAPSVLAAPDNAAPLSYRRMQPPSKADKPKQQSGLARQLAAAAPGMPNVRHLSLDGPADPVPSMLMPPPQPGTAFGSDIPAIDHLLDSPSRSSQLQQRQSSQQSRQSRHPLVKGSSMSSIDERWGNFDDEDDVFLRGRGRFFDDGLPQHLQQQPPQPQQQVPFGHQQPLMRRMRSLPVGHNAFAGVYAPPHGQPQQSWHQPQQPCYGAWPRAAAVGSAADNQFVPIRRTNTMTTTLGIPEPQHLFPPPPPRDAQRLSSSWHTAPQRTRHRPFYESSNDSDFSSALQRIKPRPKHANTKKTPTSPRAAPRGAPVVNHYRIPGPTASAPDFAHPTRHPPPSHLANNPPRRRNHSTGDTTSRTSF